MFVIYTQPALKRCHEAVFASNSLSPSKRIKSGLSLLMHFQGTIWGIYSDIPGTIMITKAPWLVHGGILATVMLISFCWFCGRATGVIMSKNRK